MSKKFAEYKGLDLARTAKEVLEKWDAEETFHRSLTERTDAPEFVFYEGPPSANGMPGIHHVMSRTIKDVICRYKTQRGYLVNRKAGWDTHGLPVELGVEKKLGITKEDIGRTISIEEYNQLCREAVMEYTGAWEELTRMMGYWVDMSDPYVTCENRYIETLWWALKTLYDKGLLYKGYTIQPYSPAAGTGLSNHELNQPGCYRDVKDTTITAQFKVVRDENSEFLFKNECDFDFDDADVYILAWTTTPWTLPSNTALAVGANIVYSKIYQYNPYTGKPQVVVLAKERYEAYRSSFGGVVVSSEAEDVTGAELAGVRYEQLLPWIKPMGDAFRVIAADFVTTTDGTGIVHIAPTFGADDDRAGRANGIVPLHVVDAAGKLQPMVDKRGRFYPIEDMCPDFVRDFVNAETYAQWAGRYVKNDYDAALAVPDAETLDVHIAVTLKLQGKALRIEKYTHNYPHCWRTDKPVLYYPLDSWFIRTTAVRDEMIALNDTINWRPASTGTGRFGKWLEGLVDWNLSRSRFWGTPLPVWATEDRAEMKCIGSIAELRDEIEKSVRAGFMAKNPLAEFVEGDFSKANYAIFDLHRPYVDEIVLVSDKGERMHRETDLIDVWFDSGAMPYAQFHYPFELSDGQFAKVFPADFIAEGVDQTRGWFFTLHALSTMLFGSVAFKNIISNGLVLDKSGNKMSKRLGNAVDPFEMMGRYGADAVRWYMMSNSQPWDNLKFDPEGVDEVRRKFFGTLYNTYSFFALYANVDGFTGREAEVPVERRPEIDRWIISLLNTLVRDVTARLEDYDPTPATRMIQEFVDENLSNWYVRLNRKRFWGGEMDEDKLAAYQTLYTCLETVAMLAAPFAPFIADRIFTDLNAVSDRHTTGSVHLELLPSANESFIDAELEEMMNVAQRISSMVLALRRKVNIKVRQPLSRIMIPVLDAGVRHSIEHVEGLIRNEVNVKAIELLEQTDGLITKRIKPNFKTLGKKYGAHMKQIAALVAGFTQDDIARVEADAGMTMIVGGEALPLELADFEITSEDMPGWLVASEGRLTVALDITVTEELRREGVARELINRIQNIRKESGFEVTDKISVTVGDNEAVRGAVEDFGDYIASQTLALSVSLAPDATGAHTSEVEIDEQTVTIGVTRM
ncbi:MAG: isoleucine--tRNA ligase [Rikenellaceae bacterium]|nr:isoleucine--tRNA ligase [Rikenellaceae bacterium]MCL2692300.1 isoleucine--tRNA ligase [Rikenellaceae bacterium]